MVNCLMPAGRASALIRPCNSLTFNSWNIRNIILQLSLKSFPRTELLFKTTQAFTFKIEKIDSKRVKGKRYSYETNSTIARKLVYSIPEGVIAEKKRRIPAISLDKLEIRDSFGDHIYRRLLLFYYQAVVYYKTGCVIEKGRTRLQHGKTSFEWSSAAHSAILPDLRDDFFIKLRNHLLQHGLDEMLNQILLALGVKEDKLIKFTLGQELTDTQVNELLDGIETEGVLSSESFFYHNMNSTVELPHYINEFDCIIEESMRKKGLEILNKVSIGELHPYDALREFVEELQDFLNRSEEANKRKLELFKKIEALETKILNLENDFSKKVFPEYLKTVQKAGRCYRKVQDERELTIHFAYKGRLTWQKNYFHEDVKLSERNFRRIKTLIARNSHCTAAPTEEWLEPWKRSLKIIELQKRYTVIPEKEMLSGKLEGGTLVPLSEAELRLQALNLIKRELT